MPAASINIQPLPHSPFQPDWIFWIFLGILIVLAGIQFLYAQQTRIIFSAVFSIRRPYHLIREGTLIRRGIFTALCLIYVLTMAMVIFSAMQLIFGIYTLSQSSFRLYLLLALSVAGFWALKVLFMNFLSMIFKAGTVNTEYKVNLILSLGVMSIVLLPCLVFALYLKTVWFLYMAFGVTVIFSVYRFLKGFLIGLSLLRFSYFFLFVYLCTLEALPLLIAAKLILTYF